MKWFSAVCFIFSILLFHSCSKTPFACFQTDVNEDSIHVNQPVHFYSACSSNAGDFFWEFYNNDDSVYFSPTVTKTFYDTGTVNVYLLVTNGRKSSEMKKDIRVKP